MSKRIKTNYPGIYYREAQRIGGKGLERVYYVVYKKDGKVFEEKAGRQYADAMTPARAATIRAQRIEGKRPSRKELREQEKAAKEAAQGRWTIDRLWQEYRSHHLDNGSINSDEGRYRIYLQPGFGDKEPKDVLLLDIDRLRLTASKKKSPQTVKHIMNLLQKIINFGVKRNLCTLSFHIPKPKVNNMKTEDLTFEQLKRLTDALNKAGNIAVANIMKLALFLGMRRGEILKLQWRDVDFDRAFITIRNPKGGRDQAIPMNDGAREVLLSQARTESPYVFPGRGGQQRSCITKAAHRITKEAGLPADFRPLHGLRHVYASMLASSGKVDMYVLQRLLTHKNPQVTMRYAHLRDQALRKASDLAGDIISDAINGKVIELKNK